MRRDRKIPSARPLWPPSIRDHQSYPHLVFRLPATCDLHPSAGHGFRKGGVAIPYILHALTARCPSPGGCWLVKYGRNSLSLKRGGSWGSHCSHGRPRAFRRAPPNVFPVQSTYTCSTCCNRYSASIYGIALFGKSYAYGLNGPDLGLHVQNCFLRLYWPRDERQGFQQLLCSLVLRPASSSSDWLRRRAPPDVVVPWSSSRFYRSSFRVAYRGGGASMGSDPSPAAGISQN